MALSTRSPDGSSPALSNGLSLGQSNSPSSGQPVVPVAGEALGVSTATPTATSSSLLPRTPPSALRTSLRHLLALSPSDSDEKSSLSSVEQDKKLSARYQELKLTPDYLSSVEFFYIQKALGILPTSSSLHNVPIKRYNFPIEEMPLYCISIELPEVPTKPQDNFELACAMFSGRKYKGKSLNIEITPFCQDKNLYGQLVLEAADEFADIAADSGVVDAILLRDAIAAHIEVEKLKQKHRSPDFEKCVALPIEKEVKAEVCKRLNLSDEKLIPLRVLREIYELVEARTDEIKARALLQSYRKCLAVLKPFRSFSSVSVNKAAKKKLALLDEQYVLTAQATLDAAISDALKSPKPSGGVRIFGAASAASGSPSPPQSVKSSVVVSPTESMSNS